MTTYKENRCSLCGEPTRGLALHWTTCNMDIQDGISFSEEPSDNVDEEHNREALVADDKNKKAKEESI